MKYDYGQEVLCKVFSEVGIAMTKHGSIVAITSVDTVDQSESFGYPLGTVVYTVEFGDGTDRLIPENELSDV